MKALKIAVFTVLTVFFVLSAFGQGKYQSTTTFSFTVLDSGTIGSDSDPAYANNYPYLSILYVAFDSIGTDSAECNFLIEFSDDGSTFYTFDTLEVAAAQDSIYYSYDYGPTEHPMTKYLRVRGLGDSATRALGLGVHATAKTTGWYEHVNPYLENSDGR